MYSQWESVTTQWVKCRVKCHHRVGKVSSQSEYSVITEWVKCHHTATVGKVSSHSATVGKVSSHSGETSVFTQ